MSFNTPILFLIFNRPTKTEQVFDSIRKLKPKRLFIAADGPRSQRSGEHLICEKVREIATNIDWDCEVETLFRDENLGCGKAISTSISWFFEQVEEGIIIEDDCLPDQSFFLFCEELLTKYRDNKQIMHIGGSNFQGTKDIHRNSYYFSNYIHVWGWATWRRAWEMYNYNISLNSEDKEDEMLKRKFRRSSERSYWRKSFEGIEKHNIDTWDIQWVYTIYSNSGLGITPNANLISNIGFGPDATHTLSYDCNAAELPLTQLSKLTHPTQIKIWSKADSITYKKFFQPKNSVYHRILLKILKTYKNLQDV